MKTIEELAFKLGEDFAIVSGKIKEVEIKLNNTNQFEGSKIGDLTLERRKLLVEKDLIIKLIEFIQS